MLRRTFLFRVWQGAVAFLGLGAVACGTRKETESRVPQRVSLGALSSIPMGRVEHRLVRVITFRDAKSISAVSMVCTHQTCILRKGSNGGFSCPCHGSQFDASGAVLNGPAVKALPWYKLSLSKTNVLQIHLDEEVDSSWRLNV